ncbi:hypothetical protein PFLUV_G00125260 [Perca fluviatilis]|uniref:Uncharacterized protein n=1 Tax=Perca fluviatilis TaxID=8168 RepID=A0A6A5ES57_PERFL|nr:hypothetical protein PFLUV_G00125260 [Perca fluviatilis]
MLPSGTRGLRETMGGLCEAGAAESRVTGPLFSVLVPWPPRSMAESWKRRLQREKWSSKTLGGAVRATDQPAGRGDAHGHVFPTRDPCRSRARHCFERPPPGSDFYALPLPWGALQRRAYACPA